MIAPGNHGSRWFTVLNRLPFHADWFGPAAIQSEDGQNCFARRLPPRLSCEFGVIAGCVALDPRAWFVMDGPNDGRVTVESTKLEGMKDFIVLPASHDTLLLDPVALMQTCYFLKHGKFYPAAVQ
jgi:hypothetical protein